MTLMYVKIEASFDHRYNDIRHDYGDVKRLVEYLEKNCVRELNEIFVFAWTDKIMHLGETTMQRVEFVHSTFKKHVGHCQANFEAVWGVIYGMTDNQHNKIKASFEQSLNMVQHGFMCHLYRHFCRVMYPK
ncbi:hypothetical protein Syun_011827 [Stephania yunnanensis]|uniref:Protein FAR1-RELATED SEQUENCE n=1 Tax=Stephania yunnanensis TaxID=152371 RepID=A0AAP0K0Q6_9MAGN